ncbi:MAG: carboxypeptidase-like regulatory domain-containing protein [Planctomycetota bacterium]
MRKGLFYSSLFIACASGAAIYFYITAPVSRAITGYVLKISDSRDAIRNINVELSPDADDKILDKLFRRSTKTDDRGWFTFPDLPEGRFQIETTAADGTTGKVTNIPRGKNLIIPL